MYTMQYDDRLMVGYDVPRLNAVSSSSSSSIYSPLTNKQSLTQSKEWQVTRET